VPEVDRPLIASDRATMLRDADLHVDRLYARAAQLGAGFIASRISRYVLDVNRGPDDVDRQVCPELASAAKKNPRALIWRQSTHGTLVLSRPLTRAELADRIERVHKPYHDQLNHMLEVRKSRFGYAILLDGHSMPSVGRATHQDTGVRRAEVVPGNNHGKSCAQQLVDVVVDHWSSAGFSVALNTPYSGGWITRHYGRPQEGVHAIQVELNRAIYLHEEAATYDGSKAPRVKSCVESLISKLTELNLSGA